MRQAGKSVSRWTAKVGETIIGGQPPSFDDIDTDVEALKDFTDVLFEDDTARRWSSKVRELLVMTLLLRYDEFMNVLQGIPTTSLVRMDERHPDAEEEEPFTCTSVRDNLFLSLIDQALAKAHADPMGTKFSKWVREAKRAFLTRNAPALPIKTIPLYGGPLGIEGILMDTRCLVDHYNQLASIAQTNHMELQHQKHTLNDIRNAFNVESKITSSHVVERIINIEKSIRRLEEHLVPIGGIPRPTPTHSRGLIGFHISIKKLPKLASLTDTTVAFFVDDYPGGYKKDINSPYWEELDSQERKSLRNKFSTVKRAVRMVLLHADSYPLMPENPSQYKNVIRDIATTAEARIRETMGFDDKTIISRHKLEKQLKLPEVKKHEKTLKLPEDTPEDIRNFFK